MRRTTLPAVLVAIAISACGSGSDPTDDLADAITSISDAGASRVHALVIDDGDTINASAGSEASVGEPALDVYEIGTSTEPFVATVVLQLIDEGRLELDSLVADALPGVIAGPHSRDVTVRHILQHTSGLTHEDPSASSTDQPGRWQLAPANYEIAGQLIQTVTSRPWTTEVESRILNPLALTHTTLASSANAPWSDAGGTALTTPGDLHRFYQALLGGELLPAALLVEMQRTTPTGEGDTGYGLGLVQRDLSCDRVTWGHSSATTGYRSEAAFTTDARHGIVVSNATVGENPQAVDAQHTATNNVIDGVLCR